MVFRGKQAGGDLILSTKSYLKEDGWTLKRLGNCGDTIRECGQGDAYNCYN